MSLAGRPDWTAPTPGAGAWMAHEQPSLALAPPVGLELRRDDGRPGYALDLFRISGGGELDMFAALTLRFCAAYDIAERQPTLFAQDLRLIALPLERGFVRLTGAAPLQGLGLGTSAALVSAGAGFKYSVRLDGHAVQAFRDIVATSAAAVIAEGAFLIEGVAMRVPGTATIDGSALLALLGGPKRSWTRAALMRALNDGRFDGALDRQSAANPAEQAAWNAALIDRLTDRCMDVTAPADGESDVGWSVRADALDRRDLTIALDDVCRARRSLVLRSPAFSTPDLHEIGVPNDDPIQIATGMEIVTIDPNIPDAPVGVAALAVELTVPANPPDRPQTIKRTVRLAAGEPPIAIPLRLSPSESLSYRFRVAAALVMGSGAGMLMGESRTSGDRHLTLRPDVFPVDFIRAEASASLLEQGDVTLSWRAEKDGRGWHAHAELSRSTPALAVARPRDCENASASATLVARDGTARLAIAIPAQGDIWLDLSSLPEAGPQSARFTAGAGSAGSMIACMADDPAATPELLRLQAEGHDTVFHWLPASPFRSGFRCRWAAQGNAPAGDWSPVLPSGSVLSVVEGPGETPWPGASTTDAPPPESTHTPINVPGVTLLVAGPGRYLYRADKPSLQTGSDGRPMIRLVTSGDLAMLQLTAQWCPTPEQIEQLRAQIAKRDGAAPSLAPAPDTVRKTALVMSGSDAAPIAAGTALGLPPQTSALSATLDPEQRDRVSRALTGEHGLIGLRYIIDAADPTSERTAFATTGPGTNTGAASTSSSFFHHDLMLEADLADLVRESLHRIEGVPTHA